MPKFWVEASKTVIVRRLVDYATTESIARALLDGTLEGEEPEEFEQYDDNLTITPVYE